MRRVFFEYDSLNKVAKALGCVQLRVRESQHSFTGFVCECHFSDPEAAVYLSELIKQQTGQFVTLRVISETHCYISVPIAEETKIQN